MLILNAFYNLQTRLEAGIHSNRKYCCEIGYYELFYSIQFNV